MRVQTIESAAGSSLVPNESASNGPIDCRHTLVNRSFSLVVSQSCMPTEVLTAQLVPTTVPPRIENAKRTE